MLKQRSDLTFKGNLQHGRHSWLRLTPAYSVKVVQHLLDDLPQPGNVLDPFSGTGTTGLTCAERDIDCDLIELNPFLAWFAQAKTRNYSASQLTEAYTIARTAVQRARIHPDTELHWVPALHQIEKWWMPIRLAALSSLYHELQAQRQDQESAALDLNLIAFCRIAIEWSNAAFNHQSMSFKEEQPTLFSTHEVDLIMEAFIAAVRQIGLSAQQPLTGQITVHQGNSRQVDAVVKGPYQYVITSPPYPNRMSYIRELRPYMYWLGYLHEAREAGDLDWAAIGGTWGIATSRLTQWTSAGAVVQHDGFDQIIDHIAHRSLLLANYVHRYFVDTVSHLTSLSRVLAPEARVFYVVGNSKFYDTLVPVEKIYGSLLAQCGYHDIQIHPLRKRNSKKELYEFIVSATW